jgi:hypothetical protein
MTKAGPTELLIGARQANPLSLRPLRRSYPDAEDSSSHASHTRRRVAVVLTALALAMGLAGVLPGCDAPATGARVDRCAAVTCGAHASCLDDGASGTCTCAPGYQGNGVTGCTPSAGPSIGGCQLFPPDHLFNTPIASLPVHPSSAAFMARLGSHRLQLDLGQTTDPASASYYGIPYNVVHGRTLPWSPIQYPSGWPEESDCAAAGATATVLSPCSAASPVVPVPAPVLVEGGINTVDTDHHMLLLDADACRLWELYHATPGASGSWNVLSTASYDLGSSALRPAGWTSADAAGFPILPLLLRAEEAASGAIHHALRVTLPTGLIRAEYTWPARHKTGSATDADLPPMGQLFRLKGSYPIPAGAGSQSSAILQALKDYGMYLADGGSTWFVQGEPSAAWDDAILGPAALGVSTADLEAVDLTPFRTRAGWSADSARVPPP